MKICSINQCKKNIQAKGFCPMHYQRYKIHGDPLVEIPQGTRHGLRKHSLYPVWKNMRNRCLNSNNKAYPNYGGRGIKVCREWDSAKKFIEYATKLPGYSTPNKTLDRIDNDGDYKPGNIRWASRQTQTLNQRVSPRNKTGYRGVSIYRGKFRATIRIDNTLFQLGDYSVAEDAAYVRDQFALQLFKEGVKLNVL